MPAFVPTSGVKPQPAGDFLVQPGVLTLASYATGGYTPVASEAGFHTVRRARPLGPWSQGYSAKWNSGTSKIQAIAPGDPNGVDLFPDVKGALFASRNTDAAATSALNAGFVHAAGMSIAAVTPITTGFTNPDYPRNVVVEITNAGGATLVAANFVIVGTDQFGAAQTETLALDVTTPTLGAGKFRNQVGVKVFATVTSFNIDTAQPASTTAALGLGTIIGLRNPLLGPAAGDVKSVEKNTAAIASSTYVPKTSQHAVDIGANLADNDDLYIEYASASQEAASGVNVGTLECEYVGE